MQKRIHLLAAVSLSLLPIGCSTTTEVSTRQSTLIAPLNTLYQYNVVNSSNKSVVTVATLAKELKHTAVVFIGELHSHSGSHKLQLDLLEALYNQNPNIILSMEQFTRDAQPIVDGYLSGKYGENTLIDDGNAWDHYKGSYRPLVVFAKEHNIPIIAANAPAMFVRCIGKRGAEFLDTIPEEKKSWSAQKLDMENESYKEKFMSFLKTSGSRHGQTKEEAEKRALKTYAAQLLRDTTMAESIDEARKRHPKHQVIHLNGSFHSDSHLGTVAVLETMNADLVTSVISPVMVTNAQNPAADVDQYKVDPLVETII